MEHNAYTFFRSIVANANYDNSIWSEVMPWLELNDTQVVDIRKVLNRNKCVRKAHVYGRVWYVFPNDVWFRKGHMKIARAPMCNE